MGRDEIDRDTGQRDRDGEREEREINIKELSDRQSKERDRDRETIRQGLRKNGKDRCSRRQRQKRAIRKRRG